MTMYELRDTAVEQALSADARRRVLVRVVLDRNLKRARNQAAFDYLAGHRVHVAWASATYAATHQKTVTADRQVSLVLTATSLPPITPAPAISPSSTSDRPTWPRSSKPSRPTTPVWRSPHPGLWAAVVADEQ